MPGNSPHMSRPSCSKGPLAFNVACLAAAALMGCSSAEDAGGQGGGGGQSTGGSFASGGSGGGPTGVGGLSGPAGAPGGAGGPGLAGAPGGAGGSGVAGVSGAAGSPGGGSGGAAGGSGGAAGGLAGSGGATSAGGTTGVAGARGGAPGSGGGGSGGGSGGGAAAGAGGAGNSCPPATPLTGGNKYCSNSTGNISGGYSYELWADGAGSGCMTVFGVGAAFSATWTGVDDFLARVGLSFDQTKTPAQIGTISADFAETKTGGTDGLVYVGVYGWTVDPLREYYILDDWGSTMPAGVASDGTPRDHVGTITVDGEVYEVWKKTRTNKPAITGDNKTFDQYFSIRQKARQCGHISVSEHFTKWMGLGLPLGKLYETKMLVEAQDSSGSVNFTKVTFSVK
jgi:endo-1,4-beta-xylanase